MILYQVTFGSYSNGKFSEMSDLVESYLVSLARNGQIFYDTNRVIPWQEKVIAYVDLVGPQAFKLKYHSQDGMEKLGKVKDYFKQEPVWGIHQDDPPTRETSWKKASSLFLYTNPIELSSPISHGDREVDIPVYLFPFSDEMRDEIYRWQRKCKHIAQIWSDGDALEISAYRELTLPDSELSQQGRSLCKEIENATGIPTYYYLDRFYRYEDYEKECCRPCPCCGKPWHVPSDTDFLHDPFFQFSFRCKTCRLVSHRGIHTSNRYAKIGDPFNK